jgi:hypothetical protein
MGGPTAVPADLEYDHNNVVYLPAPTGSAQEHIKQFPPDIHFTDEELSLRPDTLFKVLKSQLQWAAQDGEELRRAVEELDTRRRKEWTAKELVLENVMESELAIVERKGPPVLREEAGMLKKMKEDAQPSLALGLQGDGVPWWRKEKKAVDELGEQDATVKIERAGDGDPMHVNEEIKVATGPPRIFA